MCCLHHYYPTKFQTFLLQIDRDSSIFIIDVKLGWVNDVINPLICIFNTFFETDIPPEPMQIFLDFKRNSI